MLRLILIIALLPLLLTACGSEPAPAPANSGVDYPIEPDYANIINQLKAWQSTANSTIQAQKVKLAELEDIKKLNATLKDNNARLAAQASADRAALKLLQEQPTPAEQSCPGLQKLYEKYKAQVEAQEAVLVDYRAREDRLWAIAENVSGYPTSDNLSEAIIRALEGK